MEHNIKKSWPRIWSTSQVLHGPLPTPLQFLLLNLLPDIFMLMFLNFPSVSLVKSVLVWTGPVGISPSLYLLLGLDWHACLQSWIQQNRCEWPGGATREDTKRHTPPKHNVHMHHHSEAELCVQIVPWQHSRSNPNDNQMKATKDVNHNKVGAAERVDGIWLGSVTTESKAEQGYS